MESDPFMRLAMSLELESPRRRSFSKHLDFQWMPIDSWLLLKPAMIEVAPAHLAEIRRILTEHVPDCEILAFGSHATGATKPYSDLDLATVGPAKM